MTAGTAAMPNSLARAATLGSFMSWTMMSQDEQETDVTVSTRLVHTPHPAVKTSTVLPIALSAVSLNALNDWTQFDGLGAITTGDQTCQGCLDYL